MGEKMTLEKVRDRCVSWIADVAANGSLSGAAASDIRQMFDHLTQPAQAVDVWAIASRLRGASDAAYCEYIRQLSTTECLGWESKVSRGKFGRSELDAHTRAHELLGRHRALSEAAAILTAAALPNANGKERQP